MHLESSIMLLESSIMLLELPIMLLENMYSSVVTHDNHHMMIIIFLQHRPLEVEKGYQGRTEREREREIDR